ncbi:MAG: hypothetical protein IJ228_08635 [Succinivibrio sp.]|nr:hypothetical protein [Succinivibrio sp.]
MRLKFIDQVPADFDPYYFPPKNGTYIANRYLHHPVYRYRLLGVLCEGTLKCAMVVRMCRAAGRRLLRIVDMVGRMEGLASIAGNLQVLLKELNAEAVDCYNTGIDRETFVAAGFLEVGGATVIPNYFEPFVRKNISIHYAAYAAQPVVLFKADCDQDRPNVLNSEDEADEL